MKTRIAFALTALLVMVPPLSADISGITTTTVNFPATPNELTVGPDGNVWILTVDGKIGRLTPDGTWTVFSFPFTVDQFGIPYAQTMTSGADGNIWVGALNGHVERVTMQGVITDFTIESAFFQTPSIVSGADGAIWLLDVASFSSHWKLARLDVNGNPTFYDLGVTPLNSQFGGLTSGGDGNLWFIDEDGHKVMKFSIVTKSVTGSYPIPNNQGGPDKMTVASDGNVWFTRSAAIDRITPDGVITQFAVPNNGAPAAIATGGDGNIWFTDPANSKLGQLIVSSATNSGTATINETSFVASAYELFTLPSAFLSTNAHAAIVDLENNPFGWVFKTSPDQGSPSLGVATGPPVPSLDERVRAQADEQQRSDESIGLTIGLIAEFGGKSSLPGGRVVTMAASNPITVYLNLSAAPGTVIASVTPTDSSVTASFNGLSATLTGSAGSSFAASIGLSFPAGATHAIAGAATAFPATVNDSDPRNNISSFYFDPSTTAGVLPPGNSGGVVTTPVHRGH